METIADFIPWVETMRSEIDQQVIAIKGLVDTFTESDIQLIRHDQAASLRILKIRIMNEVHKIEWIEAAAQDGNNKGVILGAGAAFIFGSLFVAATRHKDAYKAGARFATSVLGSKTPFGNVLITIKGQGIPEGVEVVSISHLARESSMSESKVETSLKREGYLLMTRGQFAEFLDKMERALIDGSVRLPLARGEVIKQLPR